MPEPNKPFQFAGHSGQFQAQSQPRPVQSLKTDATKTTNPNGNGAHTNNTHATPTSVVKLILLNSYWLAWQGEFQQQKRQSFYILLRCSKYISSSSFFLFRVSLFAPRPSLGPQQLADHVANILLYHFLLSSHPASKSRSKCSVLHFRTIRHAIQLLAWLRESRRLRNGAEILFCPSC